MKHRMNLAEAYNLIIDFHQDFEDLCSIYFVRRQFPLRLCFAVTINKSQGQMFSGRVGIYLKQGIFAQGHLYVALSRECSHAPMTKRGQQELRKVVAAEVTALIRHNSATADTST